MRHELQGVLGAQQHEAVRVETAARASAGAPVPTGTARQILGARVRESSAGGETFRRGAPALHVALDLCPTLEWSHEEMVLVEEVLHDEGCSVSCVPSYMEMVLVEEVLRGDGCSGVD